MHPGMLLSLISTAAGQDPDCLNPDPADPASVELGGDPLADPLMRSDPHAFYAALSSAEATLAALLAQVRGDLSRVPSPDPSDVRTMELAREVANLKAEISVLEHQEEALKQASAAQFERWQRTAAMIQANQEALASREAQLDGFARHTADRCRLAQGLLVGRSARAASEALADWIELRAQISWPDAFQTETGTLALRQAEQDIALEMAALDPAQADSLAACLEAADAEERERLDLYRLRMAAPLEGAEDAERTVARLDALAEANRTKRATLHQKLTDLERERSERAGFAAATDGPQAWQEGLDGLESQYLALHLRLEDLPTPVNADMWCSVYVGGALVELVAGEDPADWLATATAAFGDTCQTVAAEHLDWMPFQAAWTSARFDIASDQEVTLMIHTVGGIWTVDGTSVEGLGDTTLKLRPGLHRFELRTQPGATLALVKDVAPGEHLSLGADPQGTRLTLAPMLVRGAQVDYVPPPPDPGFSLLGSSAGATNENRDVALQISTLYFSWDDGQHLGLGASASKRIWQSSYCDLALGLAYEQAFGSDLYHVVGTLRAPMLTRLSASADMRGPELWRLRPVIGGSAGLLFFRAPFVEGVVGGDLRLSPRVELRAQAGLGTSFWQEGTSQLDTAISASLVFWL